MTAGAGSVGCAALSGAAASAVGYAVTAAQQGKAGDTKTGKDQSEAVTAVLVHHDTNLYDLTVKTKTGTEVSSAGMRASR